MNMEYKIEYIKKTQVSKDAWDLHFIKPEDFDYKAGQFIEVDMKLNHPDERGHKRWFTLSSSPTEQTLDITTRKLPKHSTFKDVLFKLQKGDKINIKGPDGSFTLPSKTTKLAWIAGGIGITPFRSQMKFMSDKKIYDYDIVLLNGNRTFEDNICRSLIENYAEKNSSFKYIEILSENIPLDWNGEEGYINKMLIKKHIKDMSIRHFYVSGPEAMVDAIKAMLTTMGVKDSHIHQDWFPGYSDMF